MKITIITAAYNSAELVSQTLRSVAEQDHPDIEHILVDGASTDDTLEMVHAHRTRVSRIISEPDSGVYDAFNKGLMHASGDVVAFLNCGDTYMSSSVVSTMAEQLSDGVEAAFADLLIVDGREGHILRRYSSKGFAPRHMRYGLMPAHPTLFMRRAVYREVGEFDKSYRIAGDFEMCLRTFVLRETKYRYFADAIVRMPTGGLSNSGWRSKLRITREMAVACSRNGVRTNFARLCMRFPLKLAELVR